jgi:WD40 repeat protein
MKIRMEGQVELFNWVDLEQRYQVCPEGLSICILNTDNGPIVAMLKGHTDEVHTVQFSSDDTLLVSASPDAPSYDLGCF